MQNVPRLLWKYSQFSYHEISVIRTCVIKHTPSANSLVRNNPNNVEHVLTKCKERKMVKSVGTRYAPLLCASCKRFFCFLCLCLCITHVIFCFISFVSNHKIMSYFLVIFRSFGKLTPKYIIYNFALIGNWDWLYEILP
jgi:hypothetical protein